MTKATPITRWDILYIVIDVLALSFMIAWAVSFLVYKGMSRIIDWMINMDKKIAETIVDMNTVLQHMAKESEPGKTSQK